MKRQFLTLVTGAALLAGGAMAHEDVKNPTVKARMEVMETIRDNFGTIASMAQGKTAFDAAAAANAKAAALEASTDITTVFETEAMDPKSEAKPEIWTNWDDFADKAAALETSLSGLDTESLEAMKAGFRTVAGACGACHKAYRTE